MINSIKGVFFDPLTCQKKQNGPEKKHKKHQFVAQMEGEFYCTYVIDETGKKILISRIPISQMEKENICLEGSAFENIKNVISHTSINSERTPENNEQVSAETNFHSTNQKMMEILHYKKGCLKIK